ncbi:MAG: recombinase family protein [Planctomycetota bacterium]|jgi:DNA invertase Pin-like site-specific DNA recombinase
MKTVAAYIRVSTLDQQKGLKSQEKALRDYIKNHGITNIRWYRDKLSGADIDRPDFARLQKDVFKGKVGTVLCWKLDRLSRSLKDGINILTDWCERGIRVVAVSQQIDLNGSVGKIIAAVLLGVAQMERENIRENVKRGMMAAKARGVKLGKRPKLFAKDIKKLQGKGMNITEVARKLNVTRQAVYKALGRG